MSNSKKFNFISDGNELLFNSIESIIINTQIRTYLNLCAPHRSKF